MTTIPIHAAVACITAEGFVFGVVKETNTTANASGEHSYVQVELYPQGEETFEHEKVVQIYASPLSKWEPLGQAVNAHPALEWAVAESERRMGAQLAAAIGAEHPQPQSPAPEATTPATQAVQ